MDLVIIFTLFISFLVCGVLLLCGKATFLIAGLNTASKEEKEKWDEKKIATILGTFLLIMSNTTLVCFLLPYYNANSSTICTSIFLFVCITGSILVIFLTNRYGRKK